jgi:hypothetical protein
LRSRVNEDFLVCFGRLPEEVRKKARKSYRLWKQNLHHPSLHFKRIHRHENIYSIRVGIDWRALGLVEDDVITWFWIGSHAEYDKII